MRPRPKIFQPNLSSVASLTITLFALIFSVCYADKNYATVSLLNAVYWWAPVFAFIAVADCAVEKFLAPTNKVYPIVAFFVSALQLFFLFLCAIRYYRIDETSGGAYLAPRLAATIALFLLALASLVFKILRARQNPLLKDPILYPSFLGLIVGLGLIAFACVVWSIDVSQQHVWGGEFYPIFIALLAGVAEIGDSFYVFQSKEKPFEEKELMVRMVISFTAAAASLIAIFMAVGLYDYSMLSWICYFWSLLSSVGLCSLSLFAGAYYAYVNYRLKN
jgi:hypothetical protein